MAEERNTQVVETEQRQSRIVVVTTFLGVAASFGGLMVRASGLDAEKDGDAERLVDSADHFDTILAGSIISGIGYLLLAGTVFFLFSAAARRSDLVRTSIQPLIFIGATLLAISGVLTAVAFDGLATDFIDAGGPLEGDAADDAASDLIADSTLMTFGAFAGLAGLAALTFGVIYTALWAMRTGLVTRFWGTLGMAFGAAFLLAQFLGPIGFFGLMLWLIHVALVSRGRWMGGPLPAWEQGVAVPWPDPNAPPPEPDPEEAADPEDFEGTATEVTPERPGRRDNKRKRKRKQRG